jgi:hypothetical protein
MAIYIEKNIKKRRVFLDFMHNPSGDARLGAFELDRIAPVAKEYLENSSAMAATPLERLLKLNPQAYELYKTHGIDLGKEYLEIDVLPQHHNGGVSVSIWWESSIKHLFVIGECAGTHGIHRPGGSALNSGQVGGLRAATFIAGCYAQDYVQNEGFFGDRDGLLRRAAGALAPFEAEITALYTRTQDAAALLAQIQTLNTEAAACIRPLKKLRESNAKLSGLVSGAAPAANASGTEYRIEHCIEYRLLKEIFFISETALLSRLLQETILFYCGEGGKSRGSYVMLDSLDDILSITEGGEGEKGVEIDEKFHDKVLLSRYEKDTDRVVCTMRAVRPIPDADTWFERVWNDYRTGNIIADAVETDKEPLRNAD